MYNSIRNDIFIYSTSPPTFSNSILSSYNIQGLYTTWKTEYLNYYTDWAGGCNLIRKKIVFLVKFSFHSFLKQIF